MGEAEVREWAVLIGREAKVHQVAASLVAGVMLLESGGNPRAESPMNYSGGVAIGTAKGLMQIMPFHFAAGEDPFDPQTSIRKGCQILRAGYDRWGTWQQACAAYFGAIDGQGRITGATDVTGTSGNHYVDLAMACRQKFLDLDEGAAIPVAQVPGLLVLIDDIWGSTERIRSQLVAIKKVAGLE